MNFVFAKMDNPENNWYCSSSWSLRQGFIAFALSVSGVLLWVPDATAAQWYATPSVKQTFVFEDNRQLRITGEHSSRLSETNFSVDLGVTTPRTTVELTPRYRVSRYKGSDLADSENPYLNLVSQHAVSQRLQVGADAAYQTRSTLNSEVDDSGRFDRDGERETWSVVPWASFTISPKSTVRVTYSQSANTYSDVDPLAFVDNESESIGASGQYRWNQKLVLTSSLTGSRFVTSTRETDTYGGQLGYQYTWSPTLSFSFSGGPRVTKNKNIFGDSRTSSLLVNGGVQKQFEDTHVGLSFSRSDVSSSVGELQERENFRIDIDKDFSDVIDASLSAELDKSSTRDTLRVSPKVNWRITRSWKLSGGYRYTAIDRTDEAGEAQSNAVFLDISYTGKKRTVSR